MKKFYHFSAVATMAVAMLCGTACQEEEEIKVSNETITNVVVNKDSILTIDGKRMEWKFSLPERKKSISKGVLIDETSYYNQYIQDQYPDRKLTDIVKFSYKSKEYEFKVLRVDRKSDPGKYFYVMIDNLDVKLDTACWVYGDDERNAKKYGRLYTWYAANALAKKITMGLPKYKNNHPILRNDKDTILFPTKGRLISTKDILDIIECNTIGNLPKNGFSVDDIDMTDDYAMLYYDVFIGGLDGPLNGTPDYSRGEKTLGGYRNTFRQDPMYWNYWINGWYTGLNQVAYIWLKDEAAYGTCHYPLEIDYDDDYNYVAMINAGHEDKYGFSVRYVFEPIYN